MLCEYTFVVRHVSDRDALVDGIQTLVTALRESGQIWGQSVNGWVEGAFKLCIELPRADALASEYDTEPVKEAREAVAALCSSRPSWRVVDDRADRVIEDDWSDGGGLYLYTDLLDGTSPVRGGSRGDAVPLYRLPLAAQVRARLVDWADTYRSCDRLHIGSGALEVPAYRQLAEVDSELSQCGRTLCRAIEDATRQPTYYYLLRYWGEELGEADRPCQGCGRRWVQPGSQKVQGLAWFEFRCERCRLVSHAASSFDSKSKAAIGRWRSKSTESST